MSRTGLSTFATGIGKSLRTGGTSIANERFLVFQIAAAATLSAGVSHNGAKCIATARPHIALCIVLSFAHLAKTRHGGGRPEEEPNNERAPHWPMGLGGAASRRLGADDGCESGRTERQLLARL